jgi:hypothetical protein
MQPHGAQRELGVAEVVSGRIHRAQREDKPVVRRGGGVDVRTPEKSWECFMY